MNKRDLWLENTDCNQKELLKKASDVLLGNIMEDKDTPWSPYRCITPTIRDFGGIWNWDSAFHAVGVSYWDTDLAKEQLLGFMQFQCENGMFPDMILSDGEMNKCSSKPPVLPWSAAIVYEKCKDVEFLKNVYPQFVKNEQFWTEYRMYNGLFHYDADTNITPFDEYDLNIRWESGWDNSVRWDKPILDFWAIDLNCFMVMFYRAMAFMAKELGRDCEEWLNKENELTHKIETTFWNEELGAYIDVNRFTGEMSDVLTPASFMPLFINTASPERAKKMAEVAKEHFYPGMPTVAYDNPEYSTDYWRGPTWLNVAYFALKGLRNYGYTDLADEMKDTMLNWCSQNGIRENYNATTGEGLCAVNFSWSAAFVIEFILNFK